MADNPSVPWLLQPIYADEIGGSGGPLAQFVKIALGGNGVGTEAPGDATHGLDVDVTRVQTPVVTDPIAVASANVSRKDAAAAADQIAANINRRGLIIFNDSPQSMLVKYGTGVNAGTFSWTVRILPGWTWEMPNPIFTGIVSYLWEGATPTGGAQFTEL